MINSVKHYNLIYCAEACNKSQTHSHSDPLEILPVWDLSPKPTMPIAVSLPLCQPAGKLLQLFMYIRLLPVSLSMMYESNRARVFNLFCFVYPLPKK